MRWVRGQSKNCVKLTVIQLKSNARAFGEDDGKECEAEGKYKEWMVRHISKIYIYIDTAGIAIIWEEGGRLKARNKGSHLLCSVLFRTYDSRDLLTAIILGSCPLSSSIGRLLVRGSPI